MAQSVRNSFPSTHWSFVSMAGHVDPEDQRRALHHFLERYQAPLLTHLRTRHRLDEHDAADVLQSFITDKVIERRLLSHAVAARGRFRSFLLTTLDNFVIDDRRRTRSRRRAHEGAYAEREEVSAPASMFEVAWARQVLAEAVKRMAAECERTRRPDVWAIFDGRVLRECLHQEPPVAYDELVEKLGLPSANHAMNLLVTGKRTFARLLREVVAEYGSDEADVQSELRDLRDILARSAGVSLSM